MAVIRLRRTGWFLGPPEPAWGSGATGEPLTAIRRWWLRAALLHASVWGWREFPHCGKRVKCRLCLDIRYRDQVERSAFTSSGSVWRAHEGAWARSSRRRVKLVRGGGPAAVLGVLENPSVTGAEISLVVGRFVKDFSYALCPQADGVVIAVGGHSQLAERDIPAVLAGRPGVLSWVRIAEWLGVPVAMQWALVAASLTEPIGYDVRRCLLANPTVDDEVKVFIALMSS